MAIMLVGKVLGLLRDRMLGVQFGAYTPEGIAFMQASLLPRQFLDIMFAAVFSASFIPVFNRYLETKGEAAAFTLAAKFMLVTGAITAVVTLVAVGFASPIYALFFDGAMAPPGTRELGVSLLRLLFPLMVFSGLAFSVTGVLQSMGEFRIPAAMSAVSNGLILLYYFLFIDRFGVYGLAVAFLVGWASQLLIQLPFLVKVGFFRREHFPSLRGLWKDEGLRQMAQLAVPVMVATWLGPVNLLVNGRAVVNLYGGEHGFVAINFANQLYTIITGLFVLSLANVLFPALSKLAAVEEWAQYAKTLRESLRSLLFLLIPMAFGLAAVAHPLVRLVFQGGRFQEESVAITATALVFFAVGIVGFGFHVVLTRACYAMQFGRGPLLTAVLAMAVNGVLSFVLAPVLLIGGPALASSLSISVASAILFALMVRRLPKGALWHRAFVKDAAKCVVLSVGLFFVARGVLYFLEAAALPDNVLMRVVTVAVPALLGGALYALGSWFWRVPEAVKLCGWVRKKISVG